MNRDIESEFISWKNRQDRKPLVLMGARQVGKTWLMKNFGQDNFAKVHFFDFSAEPDLATIFQGSKNPDDILPKLEIVADRR